MKDERLNMIVGYARMLMFITLISIAGLAYALVASPKMYAVPAIISLLVALLYEWGIWGCQEELSQTRDRIEAFEASQRLEPARRAELRRQWLDALDSEFKAGSRLTFKELKALLSQDLVHRMSDELQTQRPSSETLLKRLLEARKQERYDELVDAMIRPPLSDQRA